MKSIRVGKEITIVWSGITTNGEAVSLEGRDLRIFATNRRSQTVELEFAASSNTLTCVVKGGQLNQSGTYGLTLWENLGKSGQTVLDATNVFRIVKTTDEESGLDANNIRAVTIQLAGGDISVN